MAVLESEVVDSQEFIDNPERLFLGDNATVQRKLLCLEGIILNHTITHGAEHAGVSRQHVHKWIQRDSAFAEAVHDALDQSTERLESSMYRRAMEKDTIAGIFLLKKYNPEFRDKLSIDVSAIQGEIEQRFAELNLKQLPPVMTQFIDTVQGEDGSGYEPVPVLSESTQFSSPSDNQQKTTT